MTDKQIISELKKRITKGFGKPCKELQYGCAICDIWIAFNTIETLMLVNNDNRSTRN